MARPAKRRAEAPAEDEVLPEAEREELTAESTASEREEMRETDTASGQKAPAKPGKEKATAAAKGTWEQVKKKLPDAIPDADTAFASADTDGDGFLDEEEFAAQVEETTGFGNGAALFRELAGE